MSIVSYDKVKKTVSLSSEAAGLGYDVDELDTHVKQLNTMVQQLISFPKDVPQGPEPTQKLAIETKKLHDQGVAAMKAQKVEEAIKLFSAGIDKALTRNRWESFQACFFEVSMCCMNRCDAYLLQGKFVEAFEDADFLVKHQWMVPDHYYRRALAYLEMGKLDEAKGDLERGLAFLPTHEAMKKKLEVVLQLIDEENGDA